MTKTSYPLQTCMQCGQGFSLTVARDSCRCCGLVFCGSCCKERVAGGRDGAAMPPDAFFSEKGMEPGVLLMCLRCCEFRKAMGWPEWCEWSE